MFLHQKDNEINLNNQIRLLIEDFRKLEPDYPNLPTGYTERYYESGKRHDISGAGRIVIQENLNWDDGDRYLNRYEDFNRLRSELRISLIDYIRNIGGNNEGNKDK